MRSIFRADALAVARINVRRHRLAAARARCCARIISARSRRASYDIIVSNPPYVGRRELHGLPAEYRHEPRLALAAGEDGLDSVQNHLARRSAHLNPGGILVVEVGNSETALRRAFPRLPFIWLRFARGGGGVFVLERGAARRSEYAAHRTMGSGMSGNTIGQIVCGDDLWRKPRPGARLHRRWLSAGPGA